MRRRSRILYQELKSQRGFEGSYETVKRFVAPLREAVDPGTLTQTRFETALGHQSQIDWGEARVPFRHGPQVLHFFVLTLGFRQFHLRGFDAAQGEWNLVCMAWNLKRMYALAG